MSAFFDGTYPIQPWELNASLAARGAVYWDKYRELSWVTDGSVAFNSDWRTGTIAEYSTLLAAWCLIEDTYGGGASFDFGADGVMPSHPNVITDAHNDLPWLSSGVQLLTLEVLHDVAMAPSATGTWKDGYNWDILSGSELSIAEASIRWGWNLWVIGGLYQILVAQEARLLACIDNRGRKALGDGV